MQKEVPLYLGIHYEPMPEIIPTFSVDTIDDYGAVLREERRAWRKKSKTRRFLILAGGISAPVAIFLLNLIGQCLIFLAFTLLFAC